MTLARTVLRLAYSRRVRKTSSARTRQCREVANTFGTWGKRTVFIGHSERQAHSARAILAGAGAPGRNFVLIFTFRPYDWLQCPT